MVPVKQVAEASGGLGLKQIDDLLDFLPQSDFWNTNN